MAADYSTDWRSNRARAPEPEPPLFKRKVSGFSTPPNYNSPADREEIWSIGSKFKPSDDMSSTRTSALRTRSDVRESGVDETDWRSSAKSRSTGRNGGSRGCGLPRLIRNN